MRMICETLLICLLFSLPVAARQSMFDLPPVASPPLYGNILIDRISTKNHQLPVVFSHWEHRAKYTCRVCHLELGFMMKKNTTEITEEANRKGKFCGACHNGKIVFGHTKKNCKKCHNGNRTYGWQKFQAFSAKLPQAPTGNKIDWVKAVEEGLLKPQPSLADKNYAPMPYTKELRLNAEWNMIPPAFFPHKKHDLWLDCANCHPEIFNIKKKTTKHFSMVNNLQGRFCGVCHLKVSFPMNDCDRCHPKMEY